MTQQPTQHDYDEIIQKLNKADEMNSVWPEERCFHVVPNSVMTKTISALKAAQEAKGERAIYLKSDGDNKITVLVEDFQGDERIWVPVISEYHADEHIISHIVEPLGIKVAIDKARQNKTKE